jgi:hypothetical protein
MVRALAVAMEFLPMEKIAYAIVLLFGTQIYFNVFAL